MNDEQEGSGGMEGTITVKEEYVLEGELPGRKSPGWRVPLSTSVGIGWLIFVIIWLFFYAGDYNGYQNLGIVLLSILVVALILGTAWATHALRNMTILEEVMMEIGGFKARLIASIIVPFGLMIFLVLWLFFYAVDFDIYQNIAINIVSILVMVGILGVVWKSWGWKQGGSFNQWK
ncbi:MAG: hypothetical protein E3J35_00545 [Methanomassiliicoccales archaeon]|nr:MAG: hypothetical protein E3J35_00545 [Methanomassiliicoccales archaeon]